MIAVIPAALIERARYAIEDYIDQMWPFRWLIVAVILVGIVVAVVNVVLLPPPVVPQ
jgi:uncharacterized protein involved in exopolysaccharide biosynthesis